MRLDFLKSAVFIGFGMFTAQPVLAADLPIAPEPVDYVRVCDAQGTGFFHIPGSDTCLRIAGRIRTELHVNNFGSAPNDWDGREDNSINFRARGYLYLDTRTDTEFGLLRMFSSTYLTSDNDAATALTLEFAYVQLGGFTFGKQQSFWDFWIGYSYGVQLTDYSDTKSTLAAYTAQFSNGVSASVSIEAATNRRSALISPTTNGYGGHKIPDFVSNLRIEQAWGSAQINGALHQVYFQDPTSDGALGWALGGGVELNVPVFGHSDLVAFQVAYTDGASGYPLDTWDGRITDAVRLAGGSTKTTRTWNFGGGFNHNFSETFEGNIEGGYHIADAAGSAYDFSQWGISGNLVWKPISGLGIGAELQYRRVDYNASSGLSDKDEAYATFRVQRDF